MVRRAGRRGLLGYLSDRCLVVSQPQQEDPHFVNLHWDSSPSPLHLAHRGRLLCPGLGDQCLHKHAELRSLNLQGCKTEPPEFMLDLTILKSKGFLGKCCFPRSLGLLAHFCSILALEWFAAAIFMLSTEIMNISS